MTEGDDPTAEEIIETIKDGLLDGSLQLTAPDGTVLKIDPEYLAAYILSEFNHIKDFGITNFSNHTDKLTTTKTE